MAAPTDFRSPRDVFGEHLRLAKLGDTEADIAANYAPDVVLLTIHYTVRHRTGYRRQLQHAKE